MGPSAASNADIEDACRTAWRLYAVLGPDRIEVEPVRSGLTPLADIARELGVSRQAVDQWHKPGLRKCRRWCERNGVDFADWLRFMMSGRGAS
jgi:hypothetical protein